jgi:succinate dehydrogenase hydrophobic anchor subunit
MNAAPNSKMYPLLMISAIFLVTYAVGVVYLFTHRVNGRRRRWQPLDFVWVPMGGLTGILMAALWWNSHGN